MSAMGTVSGGELRAIGYVRVSTDEQAASGLGLAAQESTVRGHCAAHGWDLLDVVRDEGASARDLDRRGVQDVLCRLARREADALVVAKLDRLTRSTLDLAHLLDWTASAGVALVALDLGLDTSTPTGRLVASVMGSVAEWEKAAIAARTRDAMAARRREGRAVSRPGIRDTAPEIAERIAHERAGGATYQRIADGLNRDQIPTVRGGALWRPSSVQTVGGYVRSPAARKAPQLPDVRRRASTRRVCGTSFV